MSHTSTTPERIRYTITGAVQGVGFRPFIYRIALENNLTGNVKNSPEGVLIELQGPSAALENFAADLTMQLPPLASIVTCESEALPAVENEATFEIVKSSGGEGHSVLISPDVATCDDCLSDMNDPENPRYLYPFTNCTNCGPRYTITRSIPYDRDKTSMSCFPMCPMCSEEYENPLDRRFHAQPNACPDCGPHVWLTDSTGQKLARETQAIRELARQLAAGKIAATKGLGGFHLVCDAASTTATATLRDRKHRYGKPLAVMVPDLATAKELAHLTEAEEQWLTGNKRPIVLSHMKSPSPLAEGIAPDTAYIGLMLPYTPLHHVLLKFYAEECPTERPAALVMTSGNYSSEPISIGNREALSRLSEIADIFLFHNRDILIRCDDSVIRLLEDEVQFLRRARGFTPAPVFLSDHGETVLGTGPELKTTLALTKGDQAFVSQHIGTMENLETYAFYKEIAAHLESILQVTPKAIVRDMHPDYMTTEFANTFSAERSIPEFTLQHHYAHIHAVMAENRFDGACIGLALDGTGYGENGTLWGGECLLVDNKSLEHQRLAHFTPIHLPGGEAAIREPWRIAQACLHQLGLRHPGSRLWPWWTAQEKGARMVTQMLDRGVNSPLSSSCGRLFDAVSAMLGLKTAVSYEAEAAIALEFAQDMEETEAYPVLLQKTGEPTILDTLGLFAYVVEDWENEVPVGRIARRFHLGLIQGLAHMTATFAEVLGIQEIGLSGGVMLNETMSTLLPRALRELGLKPLMHTELPPGDACISLGQAAYGMRRLERTQ